MIKITLPDGSVKEVEKGTSVLNFAKALSNSLAKRAVAARFNGENIGLAELLEEDGTLEILTFEDQGGKDVYRHTSSHILAQAVKRLFPEAKLAIGPSIADGFYYDFDVDTPFTPEDLAKIEQEMKKIIKENIPLERMEASREEAIAMLEKMGEPYKVELVQDLPPEAEISFYKQGDFIDLCAGPHLPSTGRVKAVKLLSVAGAYWRGDEKRPMLQRIYGTSFDSREALEEYIHRMEEAKKRDHRKLGKELDLYSIQEEGPGFPFFHPKGMVIRNELENFWRQEHTKRGYLEIKTPIILNQALWQQSGHWDHYKENMYFTEIDAMGYAVKPMNCPGGILMYKRKMHSYRDLPIRMGELGLVHRHELSGALHGLMRVRCFTQDDAHIFMLPSQIRDEIIGVIDLVDYIYGIFGFKYHVELSTKPEKAMGSDEIWDLATDSLRAALDAKGMDYKVNEGDGAFYGPKIDFHLEDCIGRTWQCGTIQLDFQMPERFDLTYVGSDGEKHRPVMIHRVIFGSIERFIAILTEHYAGAFPTWLAPVQVKVLPIGETQASYAQEIAQELQTEGVRVEVDDRNEKIGYRIREAQLEKVPYMLVVGDNEVKNKTVSVRSRKEGDLGPKDLTQFVKSLLEEIKGKK